MRNWKYTQSKLLECLFPTSFLRYFKSYQHLSLMFRYVRANCIHIFLVSAMSVAWTVDLPIDVPSVVVSSRIVVVSRSGSSMSGVVMHEVAIRTRRETMTDFILKYRRIGM